MRYIYPCPQCQTELRFPLDRGTLVLKCPSCSHSFIVDPDDTTLFKGGRFELSQNKGNFKQTNSQTNQLGFWDTLNSLDIKRVITIVLFTILFLYIIRSFTGENSPGSKKIKSNSPPSNQKQPNQIDRDPPEFNI